MRMLSTWARGGAGASQVGVPSLGGRASSPTYAHAGHAGSRDVKAAPNGDRVANGRACAGAEGDGAAQLGGLFLAQLPHRPHTLLRAATGTDGVRARVGRARGDVAGAGAERGRGACLGPLVKHNATLAALELNVLDAVRERNADHDPVHLRRRGEAGVCVRADRAEPSGQAGRHFRGCPSCDNPITPPPSLPRAAATFGAPCGSLGTPSLLRFMARECMGLGPTITLTRCVPASARDHIIWGLQ